MTPHLSIACCCGRAASVPCPTVADIPAASKAFDGWGYDERGFVRCDDCLAGRPAPSPALVAQGDLFGGGS